MKEALEILRKSIQFGEKTIKDLGGKTNLELEHKIVISLYRKLLEQTCGGYTSAVSNLGGPLRTMERSAFETYLALKYILQKEKLVQERAYSYYIGFLKNVQIEMNGWCKQHEMNESLRKEVESTMKQILKVLENPIFEKVLNKWEEKKRKSKKHYEPKWHSLSGGPNSTNELAKRLMKKDPKIETYYGSLSQESHSYNSLKDANYLQVIDKPLCLTPITQLIEPIDLCPLISFQLNGLEAIIAFIAPEHQTAFSDFIKEINKSECSKMIFG